jgi:hypothetical protein
VVAKGAQGSVEEVSLGDPGLEELHYAA